jgi:hypothetical protein
VSLFVKYRHSFGSTLFHSSCKTLFISSIEVGTVSRFVISFFIHRQTFSIGFKLGEEGG